jgi:hypothetical protein
MSSDAKEEAYPSSDSSFDSDDDELAMAFSMVVQEDEQKYHATKTSTTRKTNIRIGTGVLGGGGGKKLFSNVYNSTNGGGGGGGGGVGGGGAMTFGVVSEKKLHQSLGAPPNVKSVRSPSLSSHAIDIIEGVEDGGGKDGWKQRSMARRKKVSKKKGGHKEENRKKRESFSLQYSSSSSSSSSEEKVEHQQQQPMNFQNVNQTNVSTSGGNTGGSGGSVFADDFSSFLGETSGPDPKAAVEYYNLAGAKGVYRRLVKYLLQSVHTVSEVFNTSKNPGHPSEEKLANMISSSLERAKNAFHITKIMHEATVRTICRELDLVPDTALPRLNELHLMPGKLLIK